MSYRIYSKWLHMTLPFPFATRAVAEKHLATFTYPDDFGIMECKERCITEEQRLIQDDREFESDMLEYYVETGEDKIQL